MEQLMRDYNIPVNRRDDYAPGNISNGVWITGNGFRSTINPIKISASGGGARGGGRSTPFSASSCVNQLNVRYYKLDHLESPADSI